MRLPFLLLLIVLILSGCSSNTSIKETRNIYDSFFENKIEVREYIDKKIKSIYKGSFKITPKRIKNGKLIGLIRPDDNSTYYFFVFDLKKKDLQYLIKNPFTALRYYEIEYDYDENKIYAYSQLGLKGLLFFDCLRGKVGEIKISINEFKSAPGTITVLGNKLFFTQSPLGSMAYNTTGNQFLSLRNNHDNTISYIYSDIAFPASDNLNLVSGKKNDKQILAYLLDSTFKVLREINLKDDNVASTGNFKMIKSDSGYVIFNRRECFFYNQNEQLLKWEIKYKKDFQNAILIEKNSILFSISDSNRSEILKIDISTGNIVWSKSYPISAFYAKNIGVSQSSKTIIINSIDAISVINYNGQPVLLPYNMQWHQKDFSLFQDQLNNDTYLYLGDGLFYW
jgi:hypothetical protein